MEGQKNSLKYTYTDVLKKHNHPKTYMYQIVRSFATVQTKKSLLLYILG